MPLLAGLLVVTFAIAADLAHEAWSTALAQQRTATRAGEDFVRYAATGAAYETQAAMALALRALFAPVAAANHVAPPPAAIIARGVQHVRDCRCAPLVVPRTYFRLRLTCSMAMTSNSPATPCPPAEREWLRDTIAAHLRLVRQPDWDDALLYGVVDGRPRVVGYTPRPAGDAAPETSMASSATLPPSARPSSRRAPAPARPARASRPRRRATTRCCELS